MLNEGVDMMSGALGFMVSAVHSDDQIDRTVDAFESALASIREEAVVT